VAVRDDCTERIGCFHPTINGEPSTGGEIQAGLRAIVKIVIDAIKTKRLPDQTGPKRRSVLQGSVVGALDIHGISVTRPPTDQAGGRYNALGKTVVY